MATITELPKASLTFEQKLDRLAQVAVNVGLGTGSFAVLNQNGANSVVNVTSANSNHNFTAGVGGTMPPM